MQTRWVLATGTAAMAAATLAPSTAAPAARAPFCTAAQLAGAIIDVQGAAGSRFGRLVLTNRSAATCRTKGFVGGQLVAPDGTNLPTTVVRDTSKTPRTVRVRSGAAAVARISWNVVPSGNQPCRKARWFKVTPPDGVTTLRVFFGGTACRGRVTVGPMRRA